MRFEIPRGEGCLLCGGESRVYWSDGTQTLRDCRSCRFLYVWPRALRQAQGDPSTTLRVSGREAARGEPFDKLRASCGPELAEGLVEPRADFEIGSKYVREGKLHIAKSSLYGTILDRIQSRQSGGSLLDVGSHVGGFLLSARERGFHVAGIEPSLPAARLARRYGRFKIWSATFDRAPVKAASVDVITLLDVIEHLIDPVGAVKRASRLLKKRGILAIKTPSLAYTRLKLAVVDPLRRRVPRWLYLEPGGHLQYFSPRSIERILASAGFELLSAESLPYDSALDGRWRSLILNSLARPRRVRLSRLSRDMLCLAVKS